MWIDRIGCTSWRIRSHVEASGAWKPQIRDTIFHRHRAGLSSRRMSRTASSSHRRRCLSRRLSQYFHCGSAPSFRWAAGRCAGRGRRASQTDSVVGRVRVRDATFAKRKANCQECRAPKVNLLGTARSTVTIGTGVGHSAENSGNGRKKTDWFVDHLGKGSARCLSEEREIREPWLDRGDKHALPNI